MKTKIAALLAVIVVVGLAACGPTGSAPSTGAHPSCAHDADGSMGDPDGDCSGS